MSRDSSTSKGTRAARTSRDQRRRILGQNFLTDESIANDFVSSAAITRDDLVIEIGAGGGAITRRLASLTDHLSALEVDPDWASSLRSDFADAENVKVVEGDAREFHWPREPYRVVSCVPFGITTDLFHVLLDDPRRPLKRADLIVQHEVGRKRAVRGRSNVLNLSWEPWFSFRFMRRIPANAFRPAPAVDAAYIVVERRQEPLIDESEAAEFRQFVRNSFSKGGLLRAGLRSQLSKFQVRRLRDVREFDEKTRCNTFDIDDWVALFVAARTFLEKGE